MPFGNIPQVAPTGCLWSPLGSHSGPKHSATFHAKPFKFNTFHHHYFQSLGNQQIPNESPSTFIGSLSISSNIPSNMVVGSSSYNVIVGSYRCQHSTSYTLIVGSYRCQHLFQSSTLLISSFDCWIDSKFYTSTWHMVALRITCRFYSAHGCFM